MITYVLLWYLIGYISCSYIIWTDICLGQAKGMVDRPLEGIAIQSFIALLGPLVFCAAIYIAYVESGDNAYKNLNPDDLFTDEDLREWAKDLDPTDLFSDKVLEEWAYDQGFKL